MYPSDFETADAAYSPVDGPLFLGLPPLMTLMLLLLILAIAAGMYFLGRWHMEQGGGTDADRAPEDIHKAILNASLRAMGASSNDLKSRAEALRALIQDLLGPVLDVAKGVSGPVKALDEALKGESKEPAKADNAHGKGHGDGHDHGGKPAHDCRCGTPKSCTCPPASVTINKIYVGGAPLGSGGGCGCTGAHKPGCGHAPGKHGHGEKAHGSDHETRVMTGREQTDAISRAVRLFHDHWSQDQARIRELKDALRALSRRPPPSTVRREGRNVWDI
ncbi:MAG: hypothetical protein KKA16_06140 [Alphaproteobacteria bacterium]|nr:hypothetical protein [Alphaproteobacteria bacterium]MBU2380429.1 hypothetical protein [Alphaproteobacteria bacterium]